MPKGGKNWVKPGYLASNSLAYEKEREKNINANKLRLEALGLKRFPTSFNGSDHPKRTNKKGKTNLRDTHSDDDYILSDDGDDESVDSLEHEVSVMPPVRRLTFSEPSEPSVSRPVHGRDAPLEGNTVATDMGVQDNVGGALLQVGPILSEPRATSEARASSVGSSTNRRGLSQCIGTDRRIEREGKLPVLIPPEFRQPVGPYATSFASATGMQIRQNLQRPGVRRWSKVPETSVGPIIQRVNDKFNVQGNEVVVHKAMNAKCGALLSLWSHRLYKQYKHLRDTEGEEYARNNHPKNCNLDQWLDLIDNKWSDPKFLHQSAVNSANRARSRTNHSCGSSSFATRAHKMLKDGDIDFPDFYHTCHFSKAKNDWVSSDCGTYHEEMKKLQLENNLQPNSKPLSAEELSVQCLGARSGLLKGLGMRPSTSSHSMTTSVEAREHVKHLEQKIEEMAAQMTSMYQWIQRHGYDGPGGSSAADGAS